MTETETEIGSEFPLRPPEGGNLKRVRRTLTGARPSVLVGSGREALRLLLADAAARGRTRVAFPAYLCGSLLEALHESQTAVFLPTGRTLAPTPQSLRDLSRDRDADSTVLVAAPYFGAAFPPEVVDGLQGVWAAGVEILEDRSHSLLSDPAHLTAARGCASLRKWAALPDGGIAFGTAVDDLKPEGEPGGPSADLRREGMTLKAAWLDTGAGDKDTFLERIRAGEAALSEVKTVRPMTEASEADLAGWDVATIRTRRQANARRLLKGLRRIPGVEPLVTFGTDETPLGVPVLCDHRDRIRHALTAQEIYCPIHWELPAAVTPDRFRHEHAIQARILTLVCDQRYGSREMTRLLDALRRIA